MIHERGGDGASGAPGALDSAFHQAVALRRAGALSRAEAVCARILEVDSRHFHAHHLRGLLALDRHDMAEGVASLCRSLAINPNQAMVYSNLGNALLSLDQPERALASLDEALRLKPDLGAAHYNRGNALKDLGRLEAALASYDSALAIMGGDARALNNKGVVLRDLGLPMPALAAFSEALAMDPRFAACRANLASTLLKLGRPQEALAVYDRALALAPHDPVALYGRGASLLELARPVEAAQAFADVLRTVPEHGPALGSLFHLRVNQCDWRDYEPLSLALHDSLRRTQRFVNALSLLSFDDPQTSQACVRTYVAEVIGPATGATDAAAVLPRRHRHGKIRLAYVSADFCDHPVAHCLVGVLERHDRRRFEVIGVSLRPRGEGVFERRVRSALDTDIDATGLRDGEVAHAMREAGVDIAVDLMGFTEGSRLGIFAHRAAPIQVGYLGFAATTGAPYIDYLLADEVVIPPGMDSCYDEQVVKLPHCYLPTDDRRQRGIVPSREAAGLPPDGLVFCAFSKAHKITPDLFGVWMRVLRAVPDSVLWLSDMGAPARANLERAAEVAAVDRCRLVFAPRVVDNATHLARLSLADLFLDTHPYNAHSTTCDALWVGVPVLTYAGRSFASRVASSALRAADLSDLITVNLADYERRALALATQRTQLEALRARLVQRKTPWPLFDTARYTADLENAYLWMQERAG